MSSSHTANAATPSTTDNVKKDSIHSIGSSDSYQSSSDGAGSPISPNSPSIPAARHESDGALSLYLKRRRKHSVPPSPSPVMQSVPGMAFRSKSLRAFHLETSDHGDDGSVGVDGDGRKRGDVQKRTSSDRLKRTFSSDHLRNGARSASSLRSKALRKMKKSKWSEALYADSAEVKAGKMVLDSCCNEVDSLLSTLRMLHYVETKHVAAIKAFSSTIHSTIDLGPHRGATNTHYFGQYLKMMASSMHSVEECYADFAAQIKSEMIDPLTLWDLQGTACRQALICSVFRGFTFFSVFSLHFATSRTLGT